MADLFEEFMETGQHQQSLARIEFLKELDQRFRTAQRNNPILYRALMMYVHGDVTHEEALKLAIVHLIESNATYKEQLLHALERRPIFVKMEERP